MGMLVCVAATFPTIECRGDNSTPCTQSIACVISTSTNAYRIGDKIPVTVDLKNVGSNDVQIAMPESLQGGIEAFPVAEPTARQISVPARVSVQTNSAYTMLQPMQELRFQILVDTVVNQTPSLAGGPYGLQVEFSYTPSPLFTGGRAHFVNDSPSELEKHRNAGVPIIEEERLWRGHVQSNMLNVTLTAGK